MFPAYPCKCPALFTWFLAHRDTLILSLMEVMLEYWPSLLDPLLFWSHGILISRSFKRPKFAFWNLRVLVLLTAGLPPCRILISTISWSLQPRLPPTFTSSTTSSCFLVQGPTTHPSLLAPPPLASQCFHQWSADFLDCLCQAILSLKQISVWLKSPRRTRACDPDDIFSCP